MTIEDLERGMKIFSDEHVHSAERLNRIEALKEKAKLEMAELRTSQASLMDSESAMMDGIGRLARVVANIGEVQARTDATVAALSEDLQRLAKRMDAFIAALRNGREQ